VFQRPHLAVFSVGAGGVAGLEERVAACLYRLSSPQPKPDLALAWKQIDGARRLRRVLRVVWERVALLTVSVCRHVSISHPRLRPMRRSIRDLRSKSSKPEPSTPRGRRLLRTMATGRPCDSAIMTAVSLEVTVPPCQLAAMAEIGRPTTNPKHPILQDRTPSIPYFKIGPQASYFKHRAVPQYVPWC
jgi:hypothetical protein